MSSFMRISLNRQEEYRSSTLFAQPKWDVSGGPDVTWDVLTFGVMASGGRGSKISTLVALLRSLN